MADSVLAKLADAYVEAEGDAVGDPRLRAGAKIKIEGCGTQFSGEYVLSSTTHQYSAERGYHTRFRVTGAWGAPGLYTCGAAFYLYDAVVIQ